MDSILHLTGDNERIFSLLECSVLMELDKLALLHFYDLGLLITKNYQIVIKAKELAKAIVKIDEYRVSYNGARRNSYWPGKKFPIADIKEALNRLEDSVDLGYILPTPKNEAGHFLSASNLIVRYCEEFKLPKASTGLSKYLKKFAGVIDGEGRFFDWAIIKNGIFAVEDSEVVEGYLKRFSVHNIKDRKKRSGGLPSIRHKGGKRRAFISNNNRKGLD